MQRDVKAYLLDIIQACEAIQAALNGIDLQEYRKNRLIRSSIEREFTIVGEAISLISKYSPETFNRITEGRRIIDFRNQLIHAYIGVNDALVWGVAERNLPTLYSECRNLFDELSR